MMKTISTIREMQRVAENLRLEGKRIGVVPTMGFLHEGHLSLIKVAREKSDVVIVTIFVNPTQFGPTEDFRRYPRDLKRDRRLAEEAGCDVLFTPSVREMYPDDFLTYVQVDRLSSILEGKFRPTHFRAVATIVAKLFNITKPHLAVFGQKDAQQAIIIKQIVRDLNFDIDILVAPIVREVDGLAMSSRNVYLKAGERSDALVLRKALDLAESMVHRGQYDSRKIRRKMRQLITSGGRVDVDYVSIVDADTLDVLPKLQKGRRTLIALAARVGNTRLIDNIVLTP
jgi:pantoate--beta-alanine ligase